MVCVKNIPAAARNQFGNVFKRFAFEFVAAIKPRAELTQIGRAVQIRYGNGGNDGKEHGDHGIDAHQCQNDQQCKRNQRIAVHQSVASSWLRKDSTLFKSCAATLGRSQSISAALISHAGMVVYIMF